MLSAWLAGMWRGEAFWSFHHFPKDNKRYILQNSISELWKYWNTKQLKAPPRVGTARLTRGYMGGYSLLLQTILGGLVLGLPQWAFRKHLSIQFHHVYREPSVCSVLKERDTRRETAGVENAQTQREKPVSEELARRRGRISTEYVWYQAEGARHDETGRGQGLRCQVRGNYLALRSGEASGSRIWRVF